MKIAYALLIATMFFLAGCTTSQEPVFCTEEAKICADGSGVGRNPEKNCEFDPCPVEFVTDAEQCLGGKQAECPDGTKYEMWNVVDGKCFQINYFRDPCGELPGDAAGRTALQISQEVCEQSGGKWNECGSPCAGTGAEFCVLMCQQQCECGGQEGYTCPSFYDCRLSGKVANEIGVCEPQANI